MTRISNVDQVLIVLRQQLQLLGKSGRLVKTAKSGTAGIERRKSAAGRIEAVMLADDLSEEDLGRTLVAALLVDEFGEGAANDPKFRMLADEVYRIIASDAQAKRLMGEALKEIAQSSG